MVLMVLALQDMELEETWSADLGAEVVAAPQVEGKTAVALSVAGVVRAVNLETGEKLWQAELKPSRLPFVLLKDRVVVVQDDGLVVGLDLATGGRKFEIPGIAGAVPTRGKDRVYLAGQYQRRGNTNAVGLHQTVACVDVAKGKLAWSVSLKMPVGPVTEVGDRLYAGGIACLEAKNGKLVWMSDVALSNAVSAPAATKDRVVAQDMIGGRVACVDAKTGKKVWTYDPADAMQPGLIPLVIDGNRLYAASLPEFACLSLDKGKVEWKAKLTGYSSFTGSGPAFSGGKAWVVHEGRLSCVDVKTGGVDGAQLLGKAGSQPQPVVVEGGLLVATDTKVIHLRLPK